MNPDSEPVAIRVEGKASFKNCGSIKDFITRMIDEGKLNFVVDFEACSGMDSTFLGVIAGSALRLRKTDPRGSLVLTHLNERNDELVHNLGLNRLLTVDNGQSVSSENTASLKTTTVSDEIAAARQVLESHRSLVEAEGKNEAKFRDVIEFCQDQIDQA